LKLVFVLAQNAKVNHFQFWMLSTMEWRLNEMAKNLDKLTAESARAEKPPAQAS